MRVAFRSVAVSCSALPVPAGAALAGELAPARRGYHDFFAVWKDVDPEIPALQQPKAEYAKVK